LGILIISCLPHTFLLLDEPFSMIEPLDQEVIKDLLLQIKQEKGIVMTDHYYHNILQIADKKLLMKGGMLIEIKDKKDLADHGYINLGQSKLITCNQIVA